jgi:hypothetical protein
MSEVVRSLEMRRHRDHFPERTRLFDDYSSTSMFCKILHTFTDTSNRMSVHRFIRALLAARPAITDASERFGRELLEP